MKRFYDKGIPGVDAQELAGKLFVIEGSDGSGRSTQTDLLTNWLERRGYPTVNVGLRRSMLVSRELERAKRGNTMSPVTLSLFYATDFADQMENRIIPALRAGFVVLADRYIYTLMARDRVRGADPEWLESLYNIALVPDIIFYLKVSPQQLVDRNFKKKQYLDYWESGMDIPLSRNLFDSFVRYQKKLTAEFMKMKDRYNFEIINGDRSVNYITASLQAKLEPLLENK